MKKVRKIKKKIKKHAEETSYFLLYKAVYIAGLSILIPMIFAFAFGGEGPWYSSPLTYLFASLFLILFAFIGLLKRKKHKGRVLMSLGKMSLIPGAIALVIFVFGRSIFYNLFAGIIPGFGKVEPLFEIFINYSIPKMGVLVLGYVIIGAVLYYIGTRTKK